MHSDEPGNPRSEIHAAVESSLRKRAAIGFLLALLLTGFLGFLSWHGSRAAAVESDWVAHTYEVMRNLELTAQQTIEIETSARGFALSGNAMLLAHFNSSRGKVAENLGQLRRLTADNPRQQLRLDRLEPEMNAILRYSGNISNTRQTLGRPPTPEQIEESETLMAAARKTIAEMQAEEDNLLQQRVLQTTAARRSTNLGLLATGVTGIVVLLLAALAVNQQIAASARLGELFRQSENRLTGVISSAMDAIITIDDQQRVVMFNRAAEKIFGCPESEALGGRLERFLPKASRGGHKRYIREFGETGTTTRDMGTQQDLKALRADGTEFPIEASISQIKVDGKKMFTAIVRDISERKQAEARSRLLATIVDSSDDAILSKDLAGTILSWNRGAEGLLGYSEAEAVGQPITLIVSASHHEQEFRFLGEIAQGKLVNREETLRIRKDGTPVEVALTLSPMRNAAGQVIGASTIVRDITDRKKAMRDLAAKTAQLVESEREVRNLNLQLEQRVQARTAELEAANKELEAFTYSVSHDLRSPLRHIAGFSKMLAEECGSDLPGDGKRLLQRIQDGTQRMGMLVDDLLNLARIGRHELRLQVMGLESIVHEVIAECQPDLDERAVEWKIGTFPFVDGDPALLKQVFQNLISNALKYSQPRSPAVIEVGATELAGETVIFVRDNGVGFNMKYADKLFGVFQRLHRAEDFEGTGVGLAIVQRIVQKHRGRIWVEAQLDKGATFFLTLGNAKEPAAHADAATAGGNA